MEVPFNHKGGMPTLQDFAVWAQDKGLKADTKTLHGVAILELCVDVYSLGFKDAVKRCSDGPRAKEVNHDHQV